MSLIVAARFQTFDQAQLATAALRSGGIAATDITSFFVNPAGQHNLYPVGGDQYASPGMRHTGRAALLAAALGFLLGGLLGAVLYNGFGVPVIVALVLPFVGAYTGSLIGTVGSGRKGAAGTRADGSVPPQAAFGGAAAADSPDAAGPAHGAARVSGEQGGAEGRHAGVLVAVQVTPETQDVATRTLRAAGGIDLEKAQGEWRDGEWVDFDPLKPPLATR